MGDFSCREVADSAPGFALDILEPAARARVAAHLIRCPECRETVSGMQDSAARLLDLGEPWEADTWDDHEDLTEVAPARRRLRVVLSVAAAALLLVGTTLGPELEQAGQSSEKPVATAVLTSSGLSVGVVLFYSGSTASIQIEVTSLPASGDMTVLLITRSGAARRLGEMEVSGGRAGWFAADPVTMADVGQVVLVDPGHRQVASAVLS